MKGRTRHLGLFVLCFLSACTSSQTARDVLKDRYVKLAPLSRFSVRTCKVEASLSEPMRLRSQLAMTSWNYNWTAMESRCELNLAKSSAGERDFLKSHRAILSAALCTLFQTHWVNSPFDDFRVEADQIEEQKDKVLIRQGLGDLGVSVSMADFLIETKTKKNGLLRAHYALNDGAWLPDWLEQRAESSILRVDQIKYRSEASRSKMDMSQMLDEFWISVGTSEPVAHTFVKILACH